jgi:hypothetical protein
MLIEYFNKQFPNNKVKTNLSAKTYSYLQYNGKNMIEPLNYIFKEYNDNLIGMERKYKTYLNIKRYYDIINPYRQINHIPKNKRKYYENLIKEII